MIKIILQYFLVGIILICISCTTRYADEEIAFTNEELNIFSNYSIGDTIEYQSNLKNRDTLIIIDYENEKNDIKSSWFTIPLASNSRWLKIKYLSNNAKYNKAETYQYFLGISKYPSDKRLEYGIDFKNFYSYSEDLIKNPVSDTLKLNNLILTNYSKIEHLYPNRIVNPKDIEFVYWTDEKGLVAYSSKDGETWTLLEE